MQWTILLDIDRSEPKFMRTSTPIQTVVMSDVPDASSLHQLGISRLRMFLPVRLSIEAVARGVGESHGVIKFFAGPKSCVGWWYPPKPEAPWPSFSGRSFRVGIYDAGCRKKNSSVWLESTPSNAIWPQYSSSYATVVSPPRRSQETGCQTNITFLLLI